MTEVKPIRRKTLWQRHDMLKSILDATEELLPDMEPDARELAQQELIENRLVQKHLRARAERAEGVRGE